VCVVFTLPVSHIIFVMPLLPKPPSDPPQTTGGARTTVWEILY